MRPPPRSRSSKTGSLRRNNLFSLPRYRIRYQRMVRFLLWCVLLVLCWPLAILALLLYPIVWLVLLPFRLVGVAVRGVLELIWVVVTLPAVLLRKVAPKR